jgi:hypothetical protein
MNLSREPFRQFDANLTRLWSFGARRTPTIRALRRFKSQTEPTFIFGSCVDGFNSRFVISSQSLPK